MAAQHTITAREAARLLAFGFFFLGMGVGFAHAKWWGL